MKNLTSVFLSALLLGGTAFAGAPDVQRPDTDVNTETSTEETTPTTQEPSTQQPATEQTAQQQTPNTGAVQQENQGAVQQQIPDEMQKPVSEVERRVILSVHAANISEIKANLVVFVKDVSDEARNLAWLLIDEHLKNERRLLQIAADHDLKLASEEALAELNPMFEESKGRIETLEGTASADFEKVYMDMMKKGHEDLLTELQGAEVGFVNSDLISFIRDTQTSVTSHIKAIDSLLKTEGGRAE